MFFFFKQKTAYEMRISDWSSDVCSSDLILAVFIEIAAPLIIPWLDGIVAEHEDQQEPLVADIGHRFICAQQLGEERKQAWMVAGTARKCAIFQLASL